MYECSIYFQCTAVSQGVLVRDSRSVLLQVEGGLGTGGLGLSGLPQDVARPTPLEGGPDAGDGILFRGGAELQWRYGCRCRFLFSSTGQIAGKCICIKMWVSLHIPFLQYR